MATPKQQADNLITDVQAELQNLVMLGEGATPEQLEKLQADINKAFDIYQASHLQARDILMNGVAP